MKRSLSIVDAFQSMVYFLEKHYEQTLSDDIGSLLGELQLLKDGKTSDPAAWIDWLDYVRKVTDPHKNDTI